MNAPEDYYSVTLANPTLQPMLKMSLHRSLVEGMRGTGVLPMRANLTEEDATRLEVWSQHCDNPGGQKAALARALAELIRVGDGVTLVAGTTPVTGNFWDAVAQL